MNPISSMDDSDLAEDDFPEIDLNKQDDENEKWISEKIIKSTFKDWKIKNFFNSSVYFNQKETLSTHYFYYKLFKFLVKKSDFGFPTNPTFKIGKFHYEVNLHLLFKIVQHYGGYNECGVKKKWMLIYNSIFPSDEQTNHSSYPIQKMKRIYVGFLQPYEEKIYGRMKRQDDDDEYVQSEEESDELEGNFKVNSNKDIQPLKVEEKDKDLEDLEDLEEENHEDTEILPPPPPSTNDPRQGGSKVHSRFQLPLHPVQTPSIQRMINHQQRPRVVNPPPPFPSAQNNTLIRPPTNSRFQGGRLVHQNRVGEGTQVIQDPSILGKRDHRELNERVFENNGPYNPYQPFSNNYHYNPPQSVEQQPRKRIKLDDQILQVEDGQAGNNENENNNNIIENEQLEEDGPFHLQYDDQQFNS